jgi:hypothetical protein
VARQGRKDPEGRAARQAYRRFMTTIDGLAAAEGLAAGYQRLGLTLRDYLGAKLRCNPTSLTYADVEPLLATAGVSAECLSHLRQVMEQCEASQYAGASAGTTDLIRQGALARQVVAELEKCTDLR